MVELRSALGGAAEVGGVDAQKMSRQALGKTKAMSRGLGR